MVSVWLCIQSLGGEGWEAMFIVWIYLRQSFDFFNFYNKV